MTWNWLSPSCPGSLKSNLDDIILFNRVRIVSLINILTEGNFNICCFKGYLDRILLGYRAGTFVLLVHFYAINMNIIKKQIHT